MIADVYFHIQIYLPSNKQKTHHIHLVIASVFNSVEIFFRESGLKYLIIRRTIDKKQDTFRM